MTVEQLAARLQVTVGEAIALCRASGVAVTAPESRVSAKDAARVRDVLEGRVPLPSPAQRMGPSGPSGSPARSFGIVAAIVVAIVATLGFGLIGRSVWGRDTDIDVSAGDCFDADLFGGVFGTGIEPAPCSQARYRAYAVLDLDDVFSEWPGVEAVEARAKDRCEVLAEGRVEGNGLYAYLYYFGPADEVAWENERSHKIVCAEPAN